jgi:hypothetical protein
MTNISITQNAIQFDSVITGSIELTEPKWEAVDDGSFHVITEQGVYYITLTDYSLNGKKYTSSNDALSYLNNL